MGGWISCNLMGAAFVACSPDGYVAVIDLQSLEVVGHIEVAPGRMGWRGLRGGSVKV